MKWILTCEHYSNHVPAAYQHLFEGHEGALHSHRGSDVNAAKAFHALEDLFDVTFHYPHTRLLIEPNRSLSHPRLFSEFSKPLSKAERKELVDGYYTPYRKQVEAWISENIRLGVAHISVHTFTGDYHAQDRSAEVGILYDPKRIAEKALARSWKICFKVTAPQLTVRSNYPYKGSADGFTTHLRGFGKRYLGIELEVRNDVMPDLHDALRSSIKALQKNPAPFA